MAALLADVGVGRPGVVAEQLVMLRAGAMAVSSVGGAQYVLAAFTEAGTALIDRSARHAGQANPPELP